MHRDGPGDLRRAADALFRALDRLGPQRNVDLSRCDAITPETNAAHLVLQGKLCAQRLYRLGAHHEHDQDSIVVQVMTVDFLVRTVLADTPDDSQELRRLVAAFERLQSLTMELERLHPGDY